ncbi:MAG: ectoine hydrolase DoeA [Tagaea sp. CACIAM 22H2]|nr:ectoine hydrolase DoeA [Tagaea sp. CACIAM 22H2]
MNVAPAIPAFDHAARLARTKLRMREAGIDVLLVPSPENMFYLAGCDGWSFYLHQMLVVAQDRATPIWIGRSVDRVAASRSPVLDAASIRPYGDDCIQSPTRHPYDFVAEQILAEGWGNATIAIAMDGYFVSPRGVDTLRRRLPEARIVDDGDMVNWQRLVKEPAEIDCMRKAGTIATAALTRAVPTVRAGRRACDTAAEILQAQTAPSTGVSGDYTAIAPLIIDGNGPAMPHTTWSDAAYRPGQLVVLEFAGAYRHYHCPIARTVSIGKPDALHQEAAAAIAAGMKAAMRACVPGAVAQDVAAECIAAIQAAGFKRAGRVGYSTGIGFPPDWGEHTISLRSGDMTKLQPGMTLFLIPALWGDSWSMGLGETLLIDESGAKPLTDLDFELIVND